MSNQMAQNVVPVLPLAAGLALCCVVGAAAGVGLSFVGGWTGGAASEAARAAVMAGVSVAAAGGVSLTLLTMICGADAGRFAMALVACSMMRMLGGLGMGLALSRSLELESRTFWAGFMIAAALVLVHETVVGVNANRRLFSGPSPASGER